ncbi:hypothetical protein BH24GEM3_BH24GEM3_21940 [soil metagenome]
MEAVIFVGIQASGKSTFYLERFFQTHVRISLDMLRTRHRERLLVQACVEAKQPFVVDNTNVLRAERGKYIEAARAGRFHVVGYYFVPEVRRALQWNSQRSGHRAIPIQGVLGTYKRLEPPRREEGFDALCAVHIDAAGEFVVREWMEGS